jgi:hypothetical protein
LLVSEVQFGAVAPSDQHRDSSSLMPV